LFRAATGEIEELSAGGLILGAFDFTTYESYPFQLHQGDILVVYSDGLTEAENPQGELFGEERLLDLIRKEAPQGSENLETKFLDAIHCFTRERAQTDDITFLLVEKYR
jgi:serine phosphatase RsbU (regulator of sigma subunit)